MVLLVGKGANGEEVCKKEVEGVEVVCEKLGFVTTQGRNRERKQTKKEKKRKKTGAATFAQYYTIHISITIRIYLGAYNLVDI